MRSQIQLVEEKLEVFLKFRIQIVQTRYTFTIYTILQIRRCMRVKSKPKKRSTIKVKTKVKKKALQRRYSIQNPMSKLRRPKKAVRGSVALICLLARFC